MNEFQPLIDELLREKAERSRRMTPEERFGEVLELSTAWYGTNDPELAERVRAVREMEERKYYGPPQPRL